MWTPEYDLALSRWCVATNHSSYNYRLSVAPQCPVCTVYVLHCCPVTLLCSRSSCCTLLVGTRCCFAKCYVVLCSFCACLSAKLFLTPSWGVSGRLLSCSSSRRRRRRRRRRSLPCDVPGLVLPLCLRMSRFSRAGEHI